MKQDKPIITSLLDTDKYKFSVQEMFYMYHARATGVYRFDCRNRTYETDKILCDLIPQINEELDHLCTLRFSEDELLYLLDLHFHPSYIEFLRGFKLDRNTIICEERLGQLHIETANAPLAFVSPFEIYVMSIVNELYVRHELGNHSCVQGGWYRLLDKIDIMGNVAGFSLTEGGTRRRASADWQRIMLNTMVSKLSKFRIAGTSNVLLSKETGLPVKGTMPHEFLQAHQAFASNEGTLSLFQVNALREWANHFVGEMPGNLIALTDTINTEAFIQDFSPHLANMYAGVRLDSGDLLNEAEKIIRHYEKLKINYRKKIFSFSDGLTIPKAIELHERLKDRVIPTFMIGTDLTNNVGVRPLQIVMKMTRCNLAHVAKLSNSPGKTMPGVSSAYISLLKETFSQNKNYDKQV